MALVYPGSAPVPRYESSLAAFLPALESGRTDRADQLALDAAAKAFGGGPAQPQQSALERLLGFGNSAGGPFTRPETTPAAPTNTLPANAMRMGGDMVSQSHALANGATDPALSDYFANARTAESGGNDLAANPNSSALGRYQFLDSTWRGLMEQYPDLGLTADGRTDGAQQERAMQRFTQDNARTLAGAGLPVNPGSLYAAHFLGAGGASQVLGQDPSAPLSAYVSGDVIAANPHLQGMSVGDFVNWANSKGSGSNGGYQPPMRNEGQVAGAKQFALDPDTLRALLASDKTRALAVNLIGAQQEAEASQGRYVVEQGPNGSVFQRDTLTGETKAILTPDQANGAKGDETFFGNPVPYQDAEGNIRFGQIGNKGTFKPIDLGGTGGQFVSPTKTVNTETEQIVMDQFGNVLSRIPIENRQASFDNAVGKGMGEAQVEGVTGAPQAVANADLLLNQIDGVLTDPALDQAIGLGGILPAIPNTDQAGVVTRIEQLQGQAFLQAFESLKGGGQITEVEGQKATAAIARLSRVQNKDDFVSALNELKSIVTAAKERAARKATPAGTQGAGPTTITDDAGYDALPSGAHFIGPDGQERVKP